MRYHLTLVSGNSKTGPIPVSITSKESCPPVCPLKNAGCYAENSYVGLHWKRVTDGQYGGSLEDFCKNVAGLPKHQVWRHNQAGDLPGEGDLVDRKSLDAIVAANTKARARGFTFTHKPVGWGDFIEVSNALAITNANINGFVINLSSNSLAHADKLAALGIGPVVTIVDDEAPRYGKTPEGRHYVVCPAQEREDTTCAKCKLCSVPKRKAIIAFRIHGVRKNRALKVIQGVV
jgi:hypothetical protein